MAWESRHGRGRYYTRSKRVNGRMVREYVGGGLIGELAATEDAEKLAERVEKREAWNLGKQELERIDGLLERFVKDAQNATRIALIDAGYYRHHRGEWRKRRVRTQTDSLENV
jgi:hypothetical protein